MQIQQVILVNEKDEVLGCMEKLEAHQKAVLHRAFSIFIFNSKGEMLLQKRSEEKYHSAGLWSNACCSHPSPGQVITEAVAKRLTEEMGFDTTVERVGHFIYRAELDNGLTEHELDYVFAGEYDGPVVFNTDEVAEVSYVKMDKLIHSLATEPERYSAWFPLAFPLIDAWWKKHYCNPVV